MVATVTSKVDYKDFAHTGPGTLSGRYMRLFWQPVYRAEDLGPGRTVPIQIMSDHLTLYRGEGGTPHLVAFRCAHRGTQLATGWVEGDCIRCRYHGWKYDETGQCVEQPGEDEPFAAKVRIRSYPTEEYLGHIFAYLGEGETPPLRRLPDFEGDGVIQAAPPQVWPCNFFNRLDNDQGHVPYTHRESILRMNRPDRLPIRSITARETDYGVTSESVGADQRSQYLHIHLPNIDQHRSGERIEDSLGNGYSVTVDRLVWWVPINDERCVAFHTDLLHLSGKEAEEFTEHRRHLQVIPQLLLSEQGDAVLAGRMRIEDLAPDMSTYNSFYIEDYVTQVGQGAIADRSGECLGRTDVGVILVRKIWERELKALADGRPLKEWHAPRGLLP